MRLVEVGPRDGLQNASIHLEPSVRAELIRRLAATGISRIEAVSFVHPERVPAMARPEEVVTGAGRLPGIDICGLVLNERGFDRAVAAGVTDVRFTFAVSDAFNRANANASSDEGLATAIRLLQRGAEEGVRVGIVLATSFGCPFEGEIPAATPLRLAEQLVDAGAREIVWADTIGVAVPHQVRMLLRSAQAMDAELGVHLHNTRNTGYANAYTALEEDVSILDASIGGLGGCPFAPGATGNIATEDLVYLLEREGVRTGVDLDALTSTATWLRDRSGLTLDGQLHRVDRFPQKSRVLADQARG